LNQKDPFHHGFETMRGLRKTTAFYALDRSSLMTMTSLWCKMTFVKQSNASAHVKNDYLSTCGVWLRISTTKLLKLNARGTSFNGQRFLPSHLTARSRRKEESDFFLSFCVCAFGSHLMTNVIDCMSDLILLSALLQLVLILYRVDLRKEGMYLLRWVIPLLTFIASTTFVFLSLELLKCYLK